MKLSANLGFLWADLSLTDAIAAAAKAGFDAVECHWPYETPAADVARALHYHGLQMLGINTRRGDTSRGDTGLAAQPGRENEARAAIDESIAYAQAVGTPCVHVMAGSGEGADAHAAFVANLAYACRQAAPLGITILIEPLNRHDAPGYFLRTTDQAIAIMDEVGAENIKLMFDCYHVQRTEGDLSTRLGMLLPRIGHIQFASVPDRSAPDQGEVDYAHVFARIAELGYTAPLGAEYIPKGPTDETLGWMARFRG